MLIEMLEREYGYTHHYIRVSHIIQDVGRNAGESIPRDEASPDTRTSALQALGNNLRKRFSNKYLAEKCIERIAVDRHTPPDGVGKGYETVGEGVDAKYSPSIAGVST